MQIQEEFQIQRPVSEAFALLTDPTRLVEWQKGTVEVHRDRTGPLVAGEHLHEVHRAAGRRLKSTVEVTAIEAPRLFELKVVEAAILFDGRWELEPAGDDATRVRFTGDLRSGGRFMRAMVARQFRAHHKRLRRLAEREPTARPLDASYAVGL